VKTIETSVTIDAPPAVVWSVITDFAAYREWNPFITAMEGEAVVGARLRGTFQLAGRRSHTLRPVVTIVEPLVRLTWRGHLVMPGLLDGEHTLALRARGEQTELLHTEHFGGVLVPLAGGTLAATRDALALMDDAARERSTAIARR
jgi:hypothetical protein